MPHEPKKKFQLLENDGMKGFCSLFCFAINTLNSGFSSSLRLQEFSERREVFVSLKMMAQKSVGDKLKKTG